MRNITRTISQFTVKAEQVQYVDGKMEVKELPDLTTVKKLSPTAIEKHFKKSLGDGTYSIVIKDIVQQDKVYSMSVDTFMKNAKVVDNEETETEVVPEPEKEADTKTV